MFSVEGTGKNVNLSDWGRIGDTILDFGGGF